MVSLKKQNGFSLMEVGIAITIGIVVVSIAAAFGQQLLMRSRAENAVSDSRRLISEVRRIYGDAPTGFVNLTNVDLKASTSGLDDLWDAGTSRYRAGDYTIDAITSNCIPGPAVGANGDGFLVTLTIEPRACKDIISAFRNEATTISTTAGSTTTVLTPSPQTTTSALIDTACGGNVANMTVSMCLN